MKFPADVDARWNALTKAKRNFLIDAGWREPYTFVFEPSNVNDVIKMFYAQRPCLGKSFSFDMNSAIQIQRTIDRALAYKSNNQEQFSVLLRVLRGVASTMNKDGVGFLRVLEVDEDHHDIATLQGIYGDLLEWAHEKGVPLVRLLPAAKILLAREGLTGVEESIDSSTPPNKSHKVAAILCP